MKTKSIHSLTSKSCSLIFAFALCTFGFNTTSEAGIVILVSDDGSNLSLTVSGSLDLSGITTAGTVTIDDDFLADTGNSLYSRPDTYHEAFFVGTWSGTDVVDVASTLTQSPSTGSGDTFGFDQNILFWDVGLGSGNSVITPVNTWTFTGQTVSSVFGTNLDAGNVLLWTSDFGSNDTISIGLASGVPEPSSAVFVCFSGIGLLLRRRRES